MLYRIICFIYNIINQTKKNVIYVTGYIYVKM